MMGTEHNPIIVMGITTNKGITMPLTVLLAQSTAAQAQGFIGRPEPSDGEGILFVLPAPSVHAFHMRGVPFALELWGFDNSGLCLDGTRMPANSPVLHALSVPTRFCIELRDGWAVRNGLPSRVFLP